MSRSRINRQLGWWVAVVLIVLLVVAWYFTHAALPLKIRVATAQENGFYHKFGETFKPYLEDETPRSVEVLSTQGSRENRQLLLEGKVDLALLFDGAVTLADVAPVAPLFFEAIYIVVRDGTEIETISELEGKSVALGQRGSGMWPAAEALLRHYQIDPASLQKTERYFGDLATDNGLDAAIVTTGVENPTLDALLRSGEFRLLPIPDAEAFCFRNPSFSPFQIPRGLFSEGPAIPETNITTVAGVAWLAVRKGATDRLVGTAIRALYENDLRSEVPTLISAHEITPGLSKTLHPAVRRYLDPYGGIDTLASFMESISAGKELLFALGAGLYLIWSRWRHKRQRAQERILNAMKRRLDRFLQETARIERDQQGSSDREELTGYLDEVTDIKLRALDELSHEDVLGDRMFLIFLIQCGNLVNRIQGKLSAAT